MSNSQPTVSVIIPAKDAADSLPATLDSIANQTYSNILEVIVAAADKATAAVASQVTVFPNRTGGTPAGLNAAWRLATGDVIVRCDAHATFPRDYIATAVSTLIATAAENVGGMQVPDGQTEVEKAIAAAMSSSFGAGDARYRVGGEAGPVETVYLGCFWKRTLEELGGYDESFARTQDYELNHRIIAGGGVVWFDPDLRVPYRPRSSFGALGRQYRDYGRAKRQFNAKHRRSLRWRQIGPPVLTVLLAGTILVSIWAPIALLFPATYAISLVAVGLTSKRSPVPVAIALATMHLSWGLGFLRGGRG